MSTHKSIDLAELLPAVFTAPDLTDEQFLALCEKFPDATLEYTEEGEVIVMPPTDPDSSDRVVEVLTQLKLWAKKIGRGKVCGPDGGFRLPSGARRSPDAAWYENYPSGQQLFPPFAPPFVIEVRSRNDRLIRAHDKMLRYIAAGVQLGWLIDPEKKTVTIYRPDREPEVLANPATVAGEGPIEGFVLDLHPIWN